jgi:hypothetical protein
MTTARRTAFLPLSLDSQPQAVAAWNLQSPSAEAATDWLVVYRSRDLLPDR